MLRDTCDQLWAFILQYARSAAAHGIDRKEDVLRMVFRLSFCAVGAQHGYAQLGPAEQQVLTTLHEFGLVYHGGFDARPHYDPGTGERGGAGGSERHMLLALIAGCAHAVDQPERHHRLPVTTYDQL